ncbi:NAD(P)/FAD-dependent oxidoreductase [Massilia sp. Leaf139]|uniref:flavin-containing monooxygenase n=1 Tax=Massilia sp. Leaf139 TaxID=1736272 RepID=UPI000700DE69|nr:NAD(P)/FAD-dependent oxidoreductase [Massilia sp. Leaf139]KQQ97314.1 FAD-containing monooxygenase EthA [Massilia sp. Leaf139]
MHTPSSSSLGDGDEILDVLIVGAGLSGIGAAAMLQRRCPGKRYAILEARAAIGGTWDLFRYPGVRSDSDMYTLGYGFKPWLAAKAIADGPDIRAYIEDTARSHGIERHIRFNHKVVRASWSSADALWTIEAETGDERTLRTVRTRFLHMCSGYYSYDHAYRPRFEGEDAFAGRIVQPQFWPQDLDYAGKRVVVIGSGATAVTLVPAMAQTAAHVTMLQRSPTYVVSRPSEYRFARRLQKRLPAGLAYWATRWRVITESMLLYRVARGKPELAKRKIVEMAKHQLGPNVDVAHFTPDYKPWDQRVCVVPDGDLFRALTKGQAEVVTDHIAHFTERGIVLRSGRELEADVVVMATGLSLSVLGGARIEVDGQPYAPSEHMAYKGMMLSEMPNSVMTFGYTNASWTLKADLTAGWVCRLLQHMDRSGQAIAVVRRDPGVADEPFLSFTSGYVQRAQALLPKQGSRRPWQVYQNYLQDMFTIRFGRIADGVMRFGPKGQLP